MLVTLSGIVIVVKLEQPSNAKSPILVTLSGIIIFVKLEQPENADSSTLVTLFGIVKFPVFAPGQHIIVFRFLSNNAPFLDEYDSLSGSTINSVKLLQLANTESPILVTLPGTVTLVKFVQ